ARESFTASMRLLARACRSPQGMIVRPPVGRAQVQPALPNWIHFGSQQAGPRVAAILSIVETCRRLKIPIRDYLASILTGLAELPVSPATQLTPAACVATNYYLHPACFPSTVRFTRRIHCACHLNRCAISHRFRFEPP